MVFNGKFSIFEKSFWRTKVVKNDKPKQNQTFFVVY